MAKHAYCSGCNAYVTLGADEACPQGHPRSMLRDVRDGAAPQPRAVAAQPDPHAEPNELLAEVLGKAFVIVPALVLLGLVVFFSVAQTAAMGVSGPMMWLSGIGSAALTLGLAAAWGLWRRHKRRG